MAFQEQLGKLQELPTRSFTFLSEAWAEMKKVYWPTRKETYAATLVVLAVTIIVAIFLGVVDFVVSRGVQAILG